MAEAGDSAPCAECGQPMRRIYDTSGPIIIRPPGYSLKPDEPGYWETFDVPPPVPQAWQRGRGQRVTPGGPHYV